MLTSNTLAAIIISVLACGSCLSSYSGEFVFDDSQAIVNNKDILPSTPLAKIFQDDFWGTQLTLNSSHKSYRPLTVLTFRWNYIFAGGLHPTTFHLVNIILHNVICLLLYVVYVKLLNGDQFYGLTAALLFAVHPVHTEAVAGIVGRADLLSALFFLLSFLSYIKSSDTRSSLLSCMFYVLSVSCAGISLFCKEQGITVLGVCVVYELFYVNKLGSLIVSQYKVLDRRKLTPTKTLFKLAGLASCAGLLLYWRYYLMNFESPEFDKVDNPASFDPKFINRFLTFNYLYVLNVWLLICPEWLCFDWSMGCVPVVTFPDYRISYVILFWCLLSILLKEALFSRTVCISLSLTILPFLPASNIFFTVGFVIAERVLYIPSMGFCLFIVLGLRKLCQYYSRNSNDFMFVCFVLVVVFFLRSHERSKEWKNESLLFNSGLKVCPLNAKVHYNIAKAASDSGDENKAVQEYKEAIRLNPEYEQAMNNLANILRNRGDLDNAENLLRKAIEKKEDFAPAWMNLGIVLATKKRYNQSEKCYLNAIRHRKNYPDCYYNLGNLYLDQQRFKLAEKAWLTAVKLKPTLTVAWNNLIILNDNTRNYSNGVSLGVKALYYLPNEASIYFNMANVLGKLSRFEEAEEYFLKANKLSPNNALYYTNLGVLYHRWKKFKEAEIYYKKALSIDNNLKSASQNYELLQKQKH